MKQLFFLLCFLITSFTYSQNFSEQWTGYFSYNNIRDVSSGNGLVYAAGENSTFIYSTLDGSIRTRSTINGLSGEEISSIYYSADFDTVLIGYESGLIDVVVGDNQNVLTVVDIVNKPSIPPTEKRINHFYEFNGFVYISTGFGISLFDLGRLEFDDSYFIGENGSSLNINQTTVFEDNIYAATSQGLRRAQVGNSNIIDFNNWSTVRTGQINSVVTFNDAIFTSSLSRNILKSTTGQFFNIFQTVDTPPLALRVEEDFLAVTLAEKVIIYDTSENNIANLNSSQDFPGNFTATSILNNTLYVGTQGSGVLENTIGTNGIEQRLPNGPLENTPFSIEAIANELWVVYGEYNVSYNPGIPTEKGVSHFVVDQGWTNIPFEEVLGATDLTNITINPENTSQVFISSFNSGLLEINEEVPTTLYNSSDGFQGISTAEGISTRINGGDFDRNGNLWLTNSRVQESIVRFSGGQIQGIPVESVLPDFDGENGFSDLTIANDGNIYIGTSSSGIMAYNPASNTLARIQGDEGAANLPSDDVRALALDRSGTLWIGTRKGLRLLFSPASMFEDPNVSTNPIIILEDDIPQEVLNDQVITDIAVDGSNNKWVGTATAGVFYFSPNGQETIFQFNTSNSPLPTNNVQGISIDPQSGTVYFATTRGIVSFDGTSTPPAEDLENVIVYPNPVRPTFQGNVTIEGLTERTNVKITDLVGNLVYEENTTSGNITWDTRAFGRHKVASGVYLILITGEQALETQIKKLMIIR